MNTQVAIYISLLIIILIPTQRVMATQNSLCPRVITGGEKTENSQEVKYGESNDSFQITLTQPTTEKAGSLILKLNLTEGSLEALKIQSENALFSFNLPALPDSSLNSNDHKKRDNLLSNVYNRALSQNDLGLFLTEPRLKANIDRFNKLPSSFKQLLRSEAGPTLLASLLLERLYKQVTSDHVSNINEKKSKITFNKNGIDLQTDYNKIQSLLLSEALSIISSNNIYLGILAEYLISNKKIRIDEDQSLMLEDIFLSFKTLNETYLSINARENDSKKIKLPAIDFVFVSLWDKYDQNQKLTFLKRLQQIEKNNAPANNLVTNESYFTRRVNDLNKEFFNYFYENVDNTTDASNSPDTNNYETLFLRQRSIEIKNLLISLAVFKQNNAKLEMFIPENFTWSPTTSNEEIEFIMTEAKTLIDEIISNTETWKTSPTPTNDTPLDTTTNEYIYIASLINKMLNNRAFDENDPILIPNINLLLDAMVIGHNKAIDIYTTGETHIPNLIRGGFYVDTYLQSLLDLLSE